jgi:hypothetical protein
MELLAATTAATAVWAAHALCGRLTRGLVRVGLEVTLLATLTAALVWLVGFAATWPSDWSDPCGERGDIVAVSKKDHLFPPSSVCTWSDGLREQRVPSWVNPVLTVSLSVAAVGAAVAIGAAARGHRSSPAGEEGEGRRVPDTYEA